MLRAFLHYKVAKSKIAFVLDKCRHLSIVKGWLKQSPPNPQSLLFFGLEDGNPLLQSALIWQIVGPGKVGTGKKRDFSSPTILFFARSDFPWPHYLLGGESAPGSPRMSENERKGM